MQEKELNRKELISFLYSSLRIIKGRKVRIVAPLSESISVECNYKVLLAIEAEFKGIKNVPAYLKPPLETTLRRLYFEIKGRLEIEKDMKGKRWNKLTRREKAVRCLPLLRKCNISDRQRAYIKDVARFNRKDKVSVDLLDNILRGVLIGKRL